LRIFAGRAVPSQDTGDHPRADNISSGDAIPGPERKKRFSASRLDRLVRTL